jgi:hypothetical protein
MSDSDRPERRAYRELEVLVRELGDELAGYRRRALVSESRLKELEASNGGAVQPDLRERVAELEQENAALQSRLKLATARTKSMLDRVHFLRQQVQASER